MTGHPHPDPAPQLAEELRDAPYPFLRVDGKGTILAANRPAAAILDRWETRVGGAIPQNVSSACAGTLETGEQISFVLHAGVQDLSIRVQRSEDRASLLFFGHDISDRLRAEQEMEILARIPEENPNPVFRAAYDGRLEYRNEAANQLLASLAYPTDRVPDGWMAQLRAVAQGAASIELEVTAGRNNWLLLFTSVEFAEYIYIHARDVTDWNRVQNELRAARDRAEAASRTKSTFLANMSHELRTPLNAIIGYSELLMEEAEDMDDADMLQEDLGKIRSAGGHLLGLIGEILDLSKIEAGKMSVLPENFLLKEVIQDTRAAVEPMVTKNGNVLRVGEIPNHREWNSDCMKIRQILLNLISNAAKFTEEGEVSIEFNVEESIPEFLLRTESPRSHLASGNSDVAFQAVPVEGDAEWATISVRDTGMGMDGETLQRLFRPFVQADSTSTRVHGGTGLGLAISRHFARMMGGEVFATSEVGQGSKFSLVLPTRVRRLKK